MFKEGGGRSLVKGGFVMVLLDGPGRWGTVYMWVKRKAKVFSDWRSTQLASNRGQDGDGIKQDEAS